MSGHEAFIYKFEELPLLIDNGFHAGLLYGEAEIHFHEDGEWSIASISLDGYDGKTVGGKQIEVERGSTLYAMLYEKLENGAFKEWIEDRIMRELEECAA